LRIIVGNFLAKSACNRRKEESFRSEIWEEESHGEEKGGPDLRYKRKRSFFFEGGGASTKVAALKEDLIFGKKGGRGNKFFLGKRKEKT